MALYTKKDFGIHELWMVYDAIVNGGGAAGSATAANQVQQLDVAADTLNALLDGNGNSALTDPDNGFVSWLATLPAIYSELDSLNFAVAPLAKGYLMNGNSNLKSVRSDVYDNELGAFNDAKTKWDGVIAANANKCYTDFQINYIVYPSASAGKTDVICRMSAMFNDPTA